MHFSLQNSMQSPARFYPLLGGNVVRMFLIVSIIATYIISTFRKKYNKTNRLNSCVLYPLSYERKLQGTAC